MDREGKFLVWYAMPLQHSLFGDDPAGAETSTIPEGVSSPIIKEVAPVDRLKNLEEKIAVAVDRVKALKEEKISLEKKIRELEAVLNDKNQEIEMLRNEKTNIKSQVEELLEELETLEI
jgi:septal ring factor EnvC (AmiA/AmiB activator)